jgi:hypothetical protein
MPYCPKCHSEFREGFTVCSDCGVSLVASLSEELLATPPAGDPAEEWVPLARLTSPQYAEMVQEALEAKGIPAVVLSSTGHFGQIGQMGFASYPPVGGAYTLMVAKDRRNDAECEAQTVLGETWEKVRIGGDEEGGAPTDDQPRRER